MFKKVEDISKEQLIYIIKEHFSKIEIFHEDYWKYPKTGDDQKTCPMLDVMFQIEHKAGYIIFIPIKKEKGNEDKS